MSLLQVVQNLLCHRTNRNQPSPGWADHRLYAHCPSHVALPCKLTNYVYFNQCTNKKFINQGYFLLQLTIDLQEISFTSTLSQCMMN